MSHKYKLLYDVEAKPEGLAKDQIPEGKSACDALFYASIIYPPDGSLSILFGGVDGRTGEELADHEWFKVWMLLTKRLGASRTLSPDKQMLCKALFDEVLAAPYRKET